MRKVISLLLALTLVISAASCSRNVPDLAQSSLTASDEGKYEAVELRSDVPKYQQYASMTPEQIVSTLTLEQKAGQMVQAAVYNVSQDDMRNNDYGSVLSLASCVDDASWRKTVDNLQKGAIESNAGIPYIYGQDCVHGVFCTRNAVYFPHNIGVGAAGDEEMAYQEGLITADEAKLCHILWTFSPVVAQSSDPRWGRTYESFGADLDDITRLSVAYTKGLIDGGLVVCAKHFFADGNTKFGTGEQDGTFMLIDRGDAQLSEAEIEDLLRVYQAQIDAGVQTIMISHSSLNGVKMHENKEYIMKLKNEMGFKGFIVSDWESVQHISGSSYEEQVTKSVNAGIDMFMEPETYDEVKRIIVDGVGKGTISEERVNDAVTRIIKVKKDAGLFDDPMFENLETKQDACGSSEYRKVAEKLVEESLVLVKNENNVLPLKKETKLYISGPAANNGKSQCGGWTMSWNGPTSKNVPGLTTIQEAFERYSEDYGIEVITDKEKASEADVVLLCLGEESYAEWNGDTEDMGLFGKLGLSGNYKAWQEAKDLGKPTVACIIAGRQVIVNPRIRDVWDAMVMCYLPGTEGKGISDVLCGCSDFTGKLPSPWYASTAEIGTDKCWLEKGYGLNYGEGFKPVKEPETQRDTPVEYGDDKAAEGTNYKAGIFKDGTYVNECANLKAVLPDDVQVELADKL
ncbi:MAG: glycoside hydrolase family 3 protein, partial [Oscillospiraceae bacterium]|nr:glycoside hydrolase family 3 protein [Oscillospiraceae bacterium]